MNILFSLPLLLTLVGGDFAQAYPHHPYDPYNDKVIYGEDNRRPVSEFEGEDDLGLLRYSNATLAQIPNWRITLNEEERIGVETRDLRSGLNICEGERFLEEPLVASCSAFLVAPDLIVTAGHCVKDKYDCKKQTWVLDFDSSGDFVSPKSTVTFLKEKTFSCKELVAWSENEKLDYALIRLDRDIKDRTPLKIRREGKTSTAEPLMVFGHPLGLPKIFTSNISIRDNSLTYIFKTNADTFSGNSGSPVIGATSGLVEGLLIRGDDDFLTDVAGRCERIARCGDKECRGESVLRSTYLPIKHIPKI